MSGTEDRNDLVKQFGEITGLDPSRSKLYLESAGWSLDLALSSFYEEADENEMSFSADLEPRDSDPAPPPPPQAPAETKGGSTSEPTKPISGVTASSNRIMTFSSLIKDDPNEEEGQAFYAGGSERSGQQVIGPGKKKSNDIVSEMFKAAREHGAEVLDSESANASRPVSFVFKGAGYKLGQGENDSEVVSPSSKAGAGGDRSQKEMVLRLWKNGFSVDDGSLRDYHDPTNKVFLDSVMRGEIPRELVREAAGAEVSLSMESHQHQEFQPPRKSLQAFAGEGHRLGCPSPNIVREEAASALVQENQVKSEKEESRNGIQVDESQPVTNIQVRLADGTRLVVKVNLTHTVGDIRRFISNANPQFSSVVFALMTTFPNKELEDDVNIKEGNLMNAVIVQRLK